MHEMGIAMQIIEIATASIPKQMKDNPVERVNLRVGKLSAVVPDSLRFCFEAAASDTQFEGTELIIEEIPVVVRCRECKTEWSISEPVFICKKCKGNSVDLITGRELEIASIEIEESSSD